jgi:hypothetical protein
MAYSIVQHFVLLLQTGHESVLGKVAWSGGVLGVCALDLLIESLDVGGKEAMELKYIALFFRKSRSLVEVGCSQKCIALNSVLVV